MACFNFLLKQLCKACEGQKKMDGEIINSTALTPVQQEIWSWAELLCTRPQVSPEGLSASL